MKPWVVLSSSSGKTLEALIGGLSKDAHLQCQAVIADRDCGSAEVAQKLLKNTKVFVESKSTIEEKILELRSKSWSDDTVVLLCGYFRILSAEFLAKLKLPVINTHPSLLPSFPGLDQSVHKEVHQHCTVGGFTVHMVDSSLDGGPIIFQHPVCLATSQSWEESRDRVRRSEQLYLPKIWNEILNSSISDLDVQLSSRELILKNNLKLNSFKELLSES